MDEFIGNQSMRLRLLWIGLILTMADDQGRMLDNPLSFKPRLFPYDQKVSLADIEKDLQLLANTKKIVRYKAKGVDGRALIQIIKWWRYQSNAQWASRSLFQSPRGWTDRIRCHEKGSGQKIVEENWQTTGGFISQPLPSRKVEFSHSIPSREDEDDPEANDEANEEPTSYPTLPQQTGKAGKEGRTWEEEVSKLTSIQRKNAEFAKRVFSSSGLLNPKLFSLSIIVATRSLNGKLPSTLLGGLASAYADESAKDKNLVAAYRIEHEEIPTEYFNPNKWNVLPDEVLRAAGIDDLRSYIVKQKVNQFTEGTINDRKRKRKNS